VLRAGDYHRYMAEVTTGSERARAEENAVSAYVAGAALAKRVLAGSSPLRLGLALNHSVLCHHHLDQPEQAIAIAQAAVEAAEVGLAGLSRGDREGSGSKRGLLVANLQEWRADQPRRRQQQQQVEAESKQKQALHQPQQPPTKGGGDDNKENESWRSRDFDGIDLLPPSLADLIELGE
jgi:14-3-3 protein epsilon